MLNQEIIIDEPKGLSKMSKTNKDLKMLLCKSHNKSSKNYCHVLHLTFNCDDLQKILPSIENFFASFCFVLTVAFKLLLIFEFDMEFGK